MLEDTLAAVGEEEEARRCLNNREVAVAVEHRIHNSDNSNHNIAARNGFGVLGCKDVQGAVVEEVVVHVEVEAESHAHGGAHVEEEDTELRDWLISVALVPPSSLVASSLRAVGLFLSRSLPV